MARFRSAWSRAHRRARVVGTVTRSCRAAIGHRVEHRWRVASPEAALPLRFPLTTPPGPTRRLLCEETALGCMSADRRRHCTMRGHWRHAGAAGNRSCTRLYGRRPGPKRNGAIITPGRRLRQADAGRRYPFCSNLAWPRPSGDIGPDNGTMVAYAYAARYPDQTEKLAVMDAPQAAARTPRTRPEAGCAHCLCRKGAARRLEQ